MNDYSLVKKIMYSITHPTKNEDEREQLESYRISNIILSILVILFVISSILRETIEIRFGAIYPFSSTNEIFIYLSLVCLIGSYLLCKKGAIGNSSSWFILILGISFPIHFGNILSSILLKWVFSDLLNSEKTIILTLILLFMFIFAFVIYFNLNKVYKKSIASIKD